MSDTYLHVRDEPMKDIMDGLQFLYPVVKEEKLSSPVELIPYYLLYLVMIKEHYLCLDRDPVRRRSADDRKVAGSQERELEGTRDRRRCKRKRIHGGLQLAELLLGAHTELLLLIDYEESKIFEFESLSYKFMRTYDDIESTCLQSFLDISDFLCSPEPAHIINVAWEILQTVLKRLVMLKRKDGGRHKDNDLLAVGDSLERSAYGNLGLSESHVTAHEPVHRTFILHIPLDCLHGLFLIWSILIHE